MMGNNQQFNSPAAAPAHSQPSFKFNTPELHPPPAPLVPGPSPGQPGNIMIQLLDKLVSLSRGYSHADPTSHNTNTRE